MQAGREWQAGSEGQAGRQTGVQAGRHAGRQAHSCKITRSRFIFSPVRFTTAQTAAANCDERLKFGTVASFRGPQRSCIDSDRQQRFETAAHIEKCN